MAYKPQKPKLVMDDVLTEIYNRTGAPINGIYQIIWTYNEIVKECLLNGVEVPLGDVGFFSWKDQKPRLNRPYWDIGLGKLMDKDLDGYRKLHMRWNRGFDREVKRVSRYKANEEKPE